MEGQLFTYQRTGTTFCQPGFGDRHVTSAGDLVAGRSYRKWFAGEPGLPMTLTVVCRDGSYEFEGPAGQVIVGTPQSCGLAPYANGMWSAAEWLESME